MENKGIIPTYIVTLIKIASLIGCLKQGGLNMKIIQKALWLGVILILTMGLEINMIKRSPVWKDYQFLVN